MQIKDLAHAVQVNVKTARRWPSTNRTPYRRHRITVAKALGLSEPELRPDLQDPEPGPLSADRAVFDVEPNTPPAASLSRDGLVDWRALLIQHAEHAAQVRILIAAASPAAVYKPSLNAPSSPAGRPTTKPPPPTSRPRTGNPPTHQGKQPDPRSDPRTAGHSGPTAHRPPLQFDPLLRRPDAGADPHLGVDTLDALHLHIRQNAEDRGSFQRFSDHFQAIREHAMASTSRSLRKTSTTGNAHSTTHQRSATPPTSPSSTTPRPCTATRSRKHAATTSTNSTRSTHAGAKATSVRLSSRDRHARATGRSAAGSRPRAGAACAGARTHVGRR